MDNFGSIINNSYKGIEPNGNFESSCRPWLSRFISTPTRCVAFTLASTLLWSPSLPFRLDFAFNFAERDLAEGFLFVFVFSQMAG
ncbi:hypothetical protein L195_g027609, partial [Trifolium pratense]